MKKSIFALVVLGVSSLAISSLAAPTKVVIKYKTFDLAAGTIDLPAPNVIWANAGTQEVELTGDGCTLSLERKQIKKIDGECDTFWDDGPLTLKLSAVNAALVNGEIQLTLEHEGVTEKIKLEAVDRKTIALPANAPMTASVVVRQGSEWNVLKATGRKLDIAMLIPGNYTAYTDFLSTGKAGYAQVEFTVPPAERPQPLEDAPPGGDVAKTPQVTGVGDDFCRMTTIGPKYLVCVDLIQNNVEFHATGGDDAADAFARKHIMLPNSAVLVVVRHDEMSKLKIELGGERGLFVSKLVSRLPDDGNADAETTPRIHAVLTSRSFGPRLPGAADLAITETDAKGNSTTQTVELLVEETHAGAIRLGIASIFGTAVNRSYEARRVNGSQQAEVVATSANDVDFELVLGTAPYLFDYLGGGPRPSVTAGPRFAPFFGIGLISVKPDEDADLAFLSSLHVGIELEFVPSFSVAGTGVIRRVTRLSAVEIGSPVDGDVPTETATAFGGALVINFSPDFFKVASKGAGGIF